MVGQCKALHEPMESNLHETPSQHIQFEYECLTSVCTLLGFDCWKHLGGVNPYFTFSYNLVPKTLTNKVD